jgi:signal transduction histidine kinase
MFFQIPDVLLMVTAVVNVGLTWFIYNRNTATTANKIFSAFVAFIAFWAIDILLFRLISGDTASYYLMKLSYISALLLAYFYYRFSFLFPHEEKLGSVHYSLVTGFTAVLAVYLLVPGVLTTGIVVHDWGKEIVLEPVTYWIFAGTFATFFLGGTLRLFLKIPGAVGKERVQLSIISGSVIAAGSFGMYFNLVLPSPIFHNFQYIWSGPVFTFFFAIVITYSIFRFSLFNPRAILAEALVYLLLTFLFVRLVLTGNFTDLAINGTLLIVVAIIGSLLIRSVTKEVEQREEIERLSQEKSEFMTFASHEIRNPITAMRGLASLIVDGTTGPVPADTRDAAQKILVAGHDVLNIIATYLSKSKMELGQIAYDKAVFDLGEATASIADGYVPHAEVKGLTFSIVIDRTHKYSVLGDQGKIKEVIGNMIDNSLKYTKQGGITVSVERHGPFVRSVITDTGVGIPKETIPQLFKKFSRADAQKVNLLGTGIGLYLAKTFIEAQGGRIWAESDGENKGSRFIIEFPAAQP